jgi:hypothetical protein
MICVPRSPGVIPTPHPWDLYAPYRIIAGDPRRVKRRNKIESAFAAGRALYREAHVSVNLRRNG